jgi:hypothetical protein
MNLWNYANSADHTRGPFSLQDISGHAALKRVSATKAGERTEMTPPPKPLMPLWLAISIVAFAIVFGFGYVALRVWFFLLNGRFRDRSAAVRDYLAKEVNFGKGNRRSVFVGFFHPYWYVLNQHGL